VPTIPSISEHPQPPDQHISPPEHRSCAHQPRNPGVTERLTPSKVEDSGGSIATSASAPPILLVPEGGSSPKPTTSGDTRSTGSNANSLRPKGGLDELDGRIEIDVLPYPQHDPARVAQRSVDPGVTLHVGRELRHPVFAVALRDVLVLGTPVPEAAIDEDRHLPPREDDVRAHTNRVGSQEIVLAESVPTTV
jgi:hypothetical protein